MYIYHALINALSTHMIHINLIIHPSGLTTRGSWQHILYKAFTVELLFEKLARSERTPVLVLAHSRTHAHTHTHTHTHACMQEDIVILNDNGLNTHTHSQYMTYPFSVTVPSAVSTAAQTRETALQTLDSDDDLAPPRISQADFHLLRCCCRLCQGCG